MHWREEEKTKKCVSLYAKKEEKKVVYGVHRIGRGCGLLALFL
jgi:hypothetical protein